MWPYQMPNERDLNAFYTHPAAGIINVPKKQTNQQKFCSVSFMPAIVTWAELSDKETRFWWHSLPRQIEAQSWRKTGTKHFCFIFLPSSQHATLCAKRTGFRVVLPLSFAVVD